MARQKAQARTSKRRATAASPAEARRSKTFRDFLAARSTAFSRLSEDEQNALASQLYQAHIGYFTHNSETKGIFPIHWKSKRGKYGSAARFDAINNRLGWFNKVLKAKVGQSAEGWELSDKARALLREYHDMSKQQHLPFYDMADRERGFVDNDNRTCRKPQGPISSKAANGTNTKFKPWKMPVNVTVDGDNLHAFLYAATARLHGDACPKGFSWAWRAWDEVERTRGRDGLERRLSETIGQSSEFLRNAWVSKLKGFVVHQSYTEATSGRLMADGVLNLQSCHREVRQAALPSHYDYDVECCHYALLASLAKRSGFATPAIDAYIADKTKLRNEMRMCTGRAAMGDVKSILSALAYGSRLSSSPIGAIARTVGEDAAKRLVQLAPLAELCREVREARAVVLESYRGEIERTGKMTNAAGRRISAKGVKANSLLAHVLQGEESEVLKVAISHASEHIVLLAHDGFVTTRPINKADLEDKIRKLTGHRLSLSESAFAPSAPRP